MQDRQFSDRFIRSLAEDAEDQSLTVSKIGIKIGNVVLTEVAIEPTIPVQRTRPLEELASTILESAARLSALVQEPLRGKLVEVTRWMHCYYSNLIEGQQTRVRDIEAALQKEFLADREKHNLQRLALAHLEVQRWASTYTGSPYEPAFILELHRRFYQALPAEMQEVSALPGKSTPMIPGALRQGDVQVGAHVGPPYELVPDLLAHFQRRYESADLSRIQRIVSVGASHHRLAWIHPFRDGNGRVVRLFSDVVIRHLGVSGGGLWSLSRGFAQNREEYYSRLANADQTRSGSRADDGRGHLSERALWEFCEFTLRTMADQITFMERLLELRSLASRIERYLHLNEPAFGKSVDKIFLLLREALVRGQFARGEAGRIVGASERNGRMLLSQTLAAGLLTSETPKGPVSLALPAKVLDSYFPRLFPIAAARD